MKHTQRTLLILLALFLAGSASAQTVRSLLRKANNEYELHAFNLAIDSYQQVLERRPDETEALGNIADCYRHLNELEQAADYYARAVQSRRVDRRHILNFAKTLKGLGRYDEARGYFIQYGQEGGDASVGNHYAETCEWAKRQGGPDPDISVENERVSTPASDFGPAYYRDRVVFSSARTDIQRLDHSVTMERFRPNLVIGGDLKPWVEDQWQQFSIGHFTFRSTKPCGRCQVVTIDPATAERGAEPLKTLAGFRQKGHKILFGLNACLDLNSAPENGVLRVGDDLEIGSIGSVRSEVRNQK